MKSFELGTLRTQPLTHGLLQTVRVLGEFRGKQELFAQQSPQVLETLRQTAVIESTESSNRIEGVVAPRRRIEALVQQRAQPETRSEQEIAGYRAVLATIHASHDGIPFTPGSVLQLHRDLYQYLPGEGGDWKRGNNEITERLPDGTRRVRFTPVAAHLTPDAMERLHARFREEWDRGELDKLLLIPTYVLDFLCIHPFTDGNGRMARLLTLLLLYQAGYEVGRYVSLERLVEETKEGYYETLGACSVGWHEGTHPLLPWWEYLLGVVVLRAYRVFEERVGAVTNAPGAKRQLVLDVVRRMVAPFAFADVARACPGVSQATIRLVMADLKAAGEIRNLRRGRDALWERMR